MMKEFQKVSLRRHLFAVGGKRNPHRDNVLVRGCCAVLIQSACLIQESGAASATNGGISRSSRRKMT